MTFVSVRPCCRAGWLWCHQCAWFPWTNQRLLTSTWHPTPCTRTYSVPTLYSVHCTLYFVHCTLHTAHFTLYTVHLTHWTLYFVRVTLFIAKFSVRLHWHCFKCQCLVESFSPPGKGRLCLPDTIGTHFSVNLARPLYALYFFYGTSFRHSTYFGAQ